MEENIEWGHTLEVKMEKTYTQKLFEFQNYVVLCTPHPTHAECGIINKKTRKEESHFIIQEGSGRIKGKEHPIIRFNVEFKPRPILE